MERYTFKLRGVEFVATVRAEELDPETLGECEYRFEGKLAERLAAVVWHETNQFRDTLGEKMESRTGEPWRRFEDPEDPEGTPDVPPLHLDANGGIMALACLVEWGNEDGKPWAFEWDGSGSPFWLFHDSAHADNDFGAWEEEGIWHVEATELALGSWSEDCANLEGAERALRSGVNVEDVLGELANLREAFRARFDEDSTALEDLLAKDWKAFGVDVPNREDYAAHVDALAEDCIRDVEDAHEIDAHEFVDASSWSVDRPGTVLALCAHGWETYYGTDLASLAFSALRNDVEAKARELFEARTSEVES